MLAITAITSATNPPRTICGAAWRLANDGSRIFTRAGRFPPSETT